jgi:hypothetical protein
MARCPNCGRETARTSDWVCEWCGYPLPEGMFKKLKKSFREVKEAIQNGEPIEEKPAPKEVKKPPRQEKPSKKPEPKREAMQPPAPQPQPQAQPEGTVQISIEALRKLMQSQPAPPAPQPVQAVPAAQPPPKPEISEKLTPVSPPPPVREAAEAVRPVPQAPVPPPRQEAPEAVRTVPPPQVKPEIPQAIEMTVAELLTAYKTEGPAADARFANQNLRLTGLVEKINVKVAMDIYSVILNDPGKGLLPQGVRCIFDRKYASALGQLTAGQTITVQGRYSGSIIDISLRDCFLIG